ncbi:MAG: transglycosylase SLT domain-containing protein, partial [Gemmatimonadetes bacterium]|nr:transglycosylase SLT domain-containing protein [Gemmatimonadota bacterium]
MPPRLSALLVWLLLGAWILVLPAPPAFGGVYQFVDENGVLHFSNVPVDRRYVPLKKRSRRRVPRNLRYDSLIFETARAQRLPPALVKAVIAAESNFDPQAVSPKGAQGLMQLMPATARSLGVRDPMLASENVRGGARYLRRLLDRYGDLSRALAAYNAGPTAVDRYGGIPPYRETRQYVDR